MQNIVDSINQSHLKKLDAETFTSFRDDYLKTFKEELNKILSCFADKQETN